MIPQITGLCYPIVTRDNPEVQSRDGQSGCVASLWSAQARWTTQTRDWQL